MHPLNTFYDEADFNPDALLKVVFPLHAETNHILFALSSPNTNGGIFSEIVNARDDDGKLLMDSTYIGAVCEACRRSGRWDACEHVDRAAATPAYKDPRRMARVFKVFDAIGMRSIISGELGGAMRGGLEPVFNPAQIAALRASWDSGPSTIAGGSEGPRSGWAASDGHRSAAAPDRIDLAICAVDPSQGGASETSVVQVGTLASFQS